MVLSLVNVALRAVTMFGRFVLLVAMAGYLTPAEVGLFALFSAASMWGVYLQGLELYLFSLRELVAADRHAWARRTRDAFVLYAIVFVAASVVWVGLFGAGLLPWRLFGWFLAILALEQIAQECYRLLNVFERPLAGSVLLFARSGCWMYVLAALMWCEPSLRRLDAVLWGWTIGAASSVALALIFLRDLPWRGLPSIDWSWLRRGLAVGLPLLIGSLAIRGIAVFDRWLVGSSQGEAARGVFGFYATIAAAVPVLAESGVGAVLYPKMMKAWQRGDRDEYRRQLRRLWLAFAGFLIVTIPLALVAVRLVIGRLQTRDYASEVAVYDVLLISAAAWTIAAVPQYALWARAMDRAMIVISVIGLVMAIGLDLVLVPRYGATGAAFGQLGAIAVVLVLRLGAVAAADRRAR